MGWRQKLEAWLAGIAACIALMAAFPILCRWRKRDPLARRSGSAGSLLGNLDRSVF